MCDDEDDNDDKEILKDDTNMSIIQQTAHY